MNTRELHPSGLPVDIVAESGVSSSGSLARPETVSSAGAATQRLRGVIDRHYDFVWRTVRYLGVEEASAEDAAQQVMCILARRLDEIAPGAEMSFLFSTAVRVASEARRAARRRPASNGSDVDQIVAVVPSPEELADERCARAVLRTVIDAIPNDLRVVFVLFEIEELTIAQIAAMVGIPIGTAASRLRRARESFQ
ncbi:MAG: sigma-70 family RNA polymerase sigma factor, partial [Polyangiaceae bacterium]